MPPEGLQSIGEEAFARCDYLPSITLPEGLQTIGDAAFADSPLLTLTIPRGSNAEGWTKEHGVPNRYAD